MKKLVLGLTCALMLSMVGCGQNEVVETTTEVTNETTTVEATEVASAEETTTATEEVDTVEVRVGSLKGPTTIGIASLINEANNGNTVGNYTFTMATAADEITTALVKGDLDIALIPANVASVLYNKTEGKVIAIDINTLGVLYAVTGSEGISSVKDLEGKTIALTGKGTTPEYVTRYLLESNGVNATLEFKSEATEVATFLATNPDAIGILPQPFVTAALAQNESLKVVLDLNEQWDAVSEDGSKLVTGVTVVSKTFLEEHPVAVAQFVAEHEASVAFAESNLDEVAAYVVELGIIAKEPIAKKAIPNCNLACVYGEELESALSGYLEVLYNMEPASVGGALPAEDFYYNISK